MKYIIKMLSSVGNVFSRKIDRDIAEIDKDVKISDNKTTIRKKEMKSKDTIIRRTRYVIAILVLVIIIAELFGIRVIVYNKMGIDPSTINADKILDMLSGIFVEVMGS